VPDAQIKLTVDVIYRIDDTAVLENTIILLAGDQLPENLSLMTILKSIW
jgi:hypothetical protein